MALFDLLTKSKSKGSVTLPPEIKKREEWFQYSKSFFNNDKERMRKNEKLYYGDFEITGVNTITKMKLHLPLSLVDTQISIISDFLPTFDIIPKNDQSSFFADMLQANKHEWEKVAKFRKKLLNCVKDGLIYKNGIIRCDAIRDKEKRYAGTDVNNIDIFTWFPSPDAVGMDIKTQARYHIFATPMHVDEIFMMSGVRVEPQGMLDEYRAFTYLNTNNTANSYLKESALFMQCYNMEAVSGETLFADPESQERLNEQYPDGRLMFWVGDKIIDDRKIDGRIPYFMYTNYKSAHRLMGIGEPELVATTTKALCQVMSSLADNVNKTANPIKKITKRLRNFRKKNIKGSPNEEVEVFHPNDLTYLTPPSMSSDTFNYITALINIAEDIPGVHDITQGKRPVGVTAARAISALQEAAQTRVRSKIQNEVTEMAEDLGKHYLYLTQKYDKSVREIRTATDLGEKKFVKYDPLGRYDLQGNKEGTPDFKNDDKAIKMSEGSYDVEVTAGLSIPQGRAAREEIAYEKLKDGVYGIRKYAIESNESNKTELIEDYELRMGTKALQQRLENQQKAAADMIPLVKKAINSVQNPDAWIDSVEEMQLVQILSEYPDLLKDPVLKLMPAIFLDRIGEAFKTLNITGGQNAQGPGTEIAQAS